MESSRWFLKKIDVRVYIDGYMCVYVYIHIYIYIYGGSDGKDSACNAGDLGLIPGSGRSPGEGKGYPLQYYCLENPMDREAWQAGSVHGVTELEVTEQLTLSYMYACVFTYACGGLASGSVA